MFLVKIVTALSGLALLGGYMGAVHPAGDSLAVFRLPLAVMFGLAVIWTDWPHLLRWPLAGLAMASLGWLGWQPRAEPSGPAQLVLYQQNLLWNRDEEAAWLAAVAKVSPDVVTLQEVSERNMALLDALAEEYPAQLHCPSGIMGEAVLSRLPFVPGSMHCSERGGVAAMQVQAAFGPVWIVSIHVSWPWPYRQSVEVTEVLPMLRALEGPVILAGDFNAVAWSHTLARLAKATGTRRVGPLTHSYALPGIGLPVGIDHVLASPDLAGGLRATPRFGSDHRGLVARLGATASERE